MVPPDARCLACDYPLRGLPDPRCPECGRPFDPADAATMRVRRDRRPTTPGRPHVKHSAGLFGLLAVSLLGVGYSRGLGVAALIGWLYWSGLAVALSTRWALGRLDRSAAARLSRWVAIVCLAVVLPASYRRGSCPHAAWLVVGPLSVTHIPHGRCGNNNGCPACSVPVGGGWYLF